MKQMYKVKYITAKNIKLDYTDDNYSRAKKTEQYINNVCSDLANNQCTIIDVENAHSFPIVIKYTQAIK